MRIENENRQAHLHYLNIECLLSKTTHMMWVTHTVYQITHNHLFAFSLLERTSV